MAPRKRGRKLTKTLVALKTKSQTKMNIELLAFVRRGDRDKARQLISEGANVNAIDSNRSKTCVDWAIQSKDSEMLQLLLSAGASANIVKGLRYNPLQRAITLGNFDMVQQLIKAGADVNSSDKRGKTCLHHAVAGKNPEIVRLLLEARANPNLCDYAQFTPLQRAVRSKEPEIVKLLIDAGANVNAKILKYYHTLVEARSVLHDAVEWANTDIVKLLLERGAKVEVDSFELSWRYQRAEPSVLYIAAANKRNKSGTENKAYLEILKLILSHNPNINGVQPHTRFITPFNVAVKTGDVDAVRLFLEQDIDLGEFDHGVSRFPNSATPLHLAVSNPEKQVLEFLLELDNWDVNHLDIDDLTALLIALILNKPDYMRLLLDNGANAKVPFGFALMSSASVNPDAVLNGYHECLKILFDSGADFEQALVYVLGMKHDIAIKCMIKFIAREESNGSMRKVNRNFKKCPWARDYYRECESELKVLRRSILQGSTSLYDVLVVKDPSLYVKSRNIVDALKSKNLVENFPKYGHEMNHHYIRIRDKLELWEQGLLCLKHLFGLDSDALHIVNDKILQLLPEHDIRNLCAVCKDFQSV